MSKKLQESKLSSAALIALSTAFLGSAMLTAPAVAQDDSEDSDDTIVVTGSRIKRDSNLESSIPVTTVGAIDIQQSSAFNAAELIRDLPSAGVPGLTSATTNFSVFSAGLESVDLRNLGDSRTLTLIDGRRVVPGVPGSAVVDFSMIPPDFIQNIEVVTGGASSVYGSEAIAGVVNVILKDDFEGVELNVRKGWREDPAGGTVRTSLTTGSAFDKGNFIANITYESSEGVKATDTPYQTDNFWFRGRDIVIQPLFSTFPEQGRFLGNLTLNDAGDVIPFTRDLGFNRQENRRLLAPQERFSAALKAEYELNEFANLSTSVLYAHVSSDSDIEPFPLSSDDVYNPNGTVTANAGVPLTNPLIPADLLAAANARGLDSIAFVRRMSEVADREGRYDRTTLDLSVGLDGPIPGLEEKNWTYNTYINYGRSSSIRNGAGQINVQNLRHALDAVNGPNGTVICRDATARAFGCVPANIFGAGNISEEAARYIAAPGQRNAETEQLTLSGVVTGDMWELPAGTMSAAFGVEYREINSADIVDALTAAGLNAGNRIDPTVGEFDVKEIFGEVLVPLVSETGFIDSVNFEGAYRYSDYSTAGANRSWKYGIVSSMFDEQLRFRAVGARAARAPDIGDLFSGNAQSFTSTTDPCNGISASDPSAGPQDATIRAACLALPGVAAALAGPAGEFVYSDLDIQSQYIFTSGSRLLKPEISDSYTIGFVWQPEMVKGLTGSIDYVNFEIEDAITNLSTNNQARACLEDNNNPNNPFCQNITRDATTSKILFGRAIPINAASFKTDAVDLQVTYQNDVPAHWFGAEEGSMGSFNARLLWTYTNSFETQSAPDAAVFDQIGNPGFPQNRANFNLGWNKGPLSLNYRMIYLGDQTYDDTDNNCTQATVDQFNAAFNATGSFCFNPGTIKYDEHAISFAYEMEDKGVRIYGGIDNLTDEFVYLPGEVTGTETDAGIFDALGRRFYVGVKKSW